VGIVESRNWNIELIVELWDSNITKSEAFRDWKRAWDTQAALSFVGLLTENTHSCFLSFVKVFCFI
jgi:hypothetical protein